METQNSGWRRLVPGASEQKTTPVQTQPEIEPGSVREAGMSLIEPGVVIQGPSSIGAGAHIKAHCVIESSRLGDGVRFAGKA